MIQVVLTCCGCGADVRQAIAVQPNLPAWAKALWKQALDAGWARDEGTYAAYCARCRVVLAEPSTQIVPVHPMQIIGVITCEGCGMDWRGETLALETHFAQHLRRAAQDEGWRLVQYGSGQFGDRCPDCAADFFAPRRLTLMQQVWSQPTTVAARALGISDKALEKQCKRLSVPKPPPGFWARYHAGQMGKCRDAIPDEVRRLLGDDFLDQVYPLP
jgi:RNase P subunit RPR2